MFEFLVFVAIIVGVVIFVRKHKREKAAKELVKELKARPGYFVAKKIQNELTQNGYEVSEKSPSADSCVVEFSVSGPESGSMIVGRPVDMKEQCNTLRMSNKLGGRPDYSICNNNIGLMIRTRESTEGEIPPLLEIAARVIRNSRYEFEHPECIYEYPEMRKYLNVMFQ